MEKFCALFAADPDGNGARCAVQAGYSEKTARQQACRLLKRPDVRARLREIRADLADELGLTAEHMTLRLNEIYRRCMQAQPVMAWDREIKEWVESGVWQFDSRGAVRAAEMLMKLGGLLTDEKVILPMGIVIREDYGDGDGRAGSDV